MATRFDESSVAAATGVVLAAGLGSRLTGVSDETGFKPLTPVAGRPLMLRTLGSLELAGCTRVVIVLGYGGSDVRKAIESHYSGNLELLFVENPLYKLSNGLSVLSAAPHVGERFLLTMADHIYGDEVMLLARGHIPPAYGATLLVDSKLDDIFDMDDAMKIRAHEGRVLDIGKQLTDFNCVDTGLFVCTPGLIQAIREEYEERGDASLSDGVARLASSGSMTLLDIGPGYWQDVDTPEMLREAEKHLNRVKPESAILVSERSNNE